MTTSARLTPATSLMHLTFNAGEDSTVEVLVVDADDSPVPLQSAVGTIALPHCATQHRWSAAAGNLTLAQETGVLYLHTTAEQTTEWAAWGDSEWQLDVVDVFGRHRRPCEGDVRVNATRVRDD